MEVKSVIMNEIEIDRSLTRIAHEIIENNKGLDDIILMGIKRRGVPIAQRLQAKLLEYEGEELVVNSLDITHYRDDLSMVSSFPQYRGYDITENINDKRIILCDDVLYTGRTARAAIEALFDYGRPKSIQLAVMIDRGHRELPIRADYVGKNVPTSMTEGVQVHISEIDGEDRVILVDLGRDLKEEH